MDRPAVARSVSLLRPLRVRRDQARARLACARRRRRIRPRGRCRTVARGLDAKRVLDRSSDLLSPDLGVVERTRAEPCPVALRLADRAADPRCAFAVPPGFLRASTPDLVGEYPRHSGNGRVARRPLGRHIRDRAAQAPIAGMGTSIGSACRRSVAVPLRLALRSKPAQLLRDDVVQLRVPLVRHGMEPHGSVRADRAVLISSLF